MLGSEPAGSPAALDKIAFVAQDAPLYKNLSVADMLHLTRNLNGSWDQQRAETRLKELRIPLGRKVGKLSGGQQAQLALTLALARRPRLLVLDEPLSSLDPLARHDFMASVMAAVAEDGLSVVLSSHVIADLERVADYLIVLSRGQVQVAGEVEGLLAGHSTLTGPSSAADDVAERLAVVYARRAGTVAHLLVRNKGAAEPAPSGMGGPPGGPGGTRPGLPARAGRRRAARARGAGNTRQRDPGMTAVTAAAPVGARRPVPWTRLVWVTWRQHRLALAGVTVLLGGLGLYLLIMGLKIRSGYASVTSCHPAGSAACGLTRSLVTSDYYPTAQTMTGFLQVVPVLVGVFVGGPVLARELETGTFRFAWTQGCGRTRWAIAKLALLAVAVIVAADAFSLLFSWYFQPWFAQGLDGALAPQLFDLRGVDFAAWTLLAFALGVAAGALIRRTVPAMVAALAAWTGLFFAYVPVSAQALPGAAGRRERQGQHPQLRQQLVVGPVVHRPERQAGEPADDQNVVARAPASVQNSKNPNVGTAYLSCPPLHAVVALPAAEQVLALPVHRGRLAARAVPDPARGHRLAGPRTRRHESRDEERVASMATTAHRAAPLGRGPPVRYGLGHLAAAPGRARRHPAACSA